MVEHGVVVASTDFVAADRFCTALMGIDPNWMKYLEWCGAAGMGTWANLSLWFGFSGLIASEIAKPSPSLISRS